MPRQYIIMSFLITSKPFRLTELYFINVSVVTPRGLNI